MSPMSVAEADHRGLVADGVDAVERARDDRGPSRTSPRHVLGARVAVRGRAGVGGGVQDVEHADLVPAGEQRVDDVRADEAGAAGDEDAAHGAHAPDAVVGAEREPPVAQARRRRSGSRARASRRLPAAPSRRVAVERARARRRTARASPAPSGGQPARRGAPRRGRDRGGPRRASPRARRSGRLPGALSATHSAPPGVKANANGLFQPLESIAGAGRGARPDRGSAGAPTRRRAATGGRRSRSRAAPPGASARCPPLASVAVRTPRQTTPRGVAGAARPTTRRRVAASSRRHRSARVRRRVSESSPRWPLGRDAQRARRGAERPRAAAIARRSRRVRSKPTSRPPSGQRGQRRRPGRPSRRAALRGRRGAGTVAAVAASAAAGEPRRAAIARGSRPPHHGDTHPDLQRERERELGPSQARGRARERGCSASSSHGANGSQMRSVSPRDRPLRLGDASAASAPPARIQTRAVAQARQAPRRAPGRARARTRRGSINEEVRYGRRAATPRRVQRARGVQAVEPPEAGGRETPSTTAATPTAAIEQRAHAATSSATPAASDAERRERRR